MCRLCGLVGDRKGAEQLSDAPRFCGYYRGVEYCLLVKFSTQITNGARGGRCAQLNDNRATPTRARKKDCIVGTRAQSCAVVGIK